LWIGVTIMVPWSNGSYPFTAGSLARDRQVLSLRRQIVRHDVLHTV
jgi:hypothetical protein